jgi:hypothetical protein
MVYLKTKNPNLGIFWRPWNGKCWYILRTFGIIYYHFVWCMMYDVWWCLWSFGILYQFWYVFTNNTLTTLDCPQNPDPSSCCPSWLLRRGALPQRFWPRRGAVRPWSWHWLQNSPETRVTIIHRRLLYCFDVGSTCIPRRYYLLWKSSTPKFVFL